MRAASIKTMGVLLVGLALSIFSLRADEPAGTVDDSFRYKPEKEIINMMRQWEKAGDTSTVPTLKKLLADNREAVRRKAGRLLGVFHAQLSDAEIKLVSEQLKSPDWREVQSGLKALRDLNAPAAVPEILPCLKHPNAYVVRDACRTLAVLGTKDVIPSIQPLVSSPDAHIQKDAQDAIDTLSKK